MPYQGSDNRKRRGGLDVSGAGYALKFPDDGNLDWYFDRTTFGEVNMPHSIIAGTSLSGKTTLAKIFCRQVVRSGRGTIVLDPFMSKWDTPRVYTDSGEFLRQAKSQMNKGLFVDESGETIGKYDLTMNWLTTTARHCGHKTWLITHRPTQISPTLRSCCENCYMFATDVDAHATLCKEFLAPHLINIRLPKYTFVRLQKFQEPQIWEIRKKALDFELVRSHTLESKWAKP